MEAFNGGIGWDLPVKRLSMTQHGQVQYELKMPYRDGMTHVIFSPIDFIGKFAALILPPLRATPDEQHANHFNIQRDFNFGA